MFLMRRLALGLLAALSGAAVLCSSAAIRVVDGVNGNNENDLLVTNEFGKVSSRIYGPAVDLGCYEWRPTDGLMLFVR